MSDKSVVNPIETAKELKQLPLNERLPAIENMLGGISDDLLSKLVGDRNVHGARMMAHYLGGAGTPMRVKLDDEEWSRLIDLANLKAEESGGWKKSRNKKYPASEGWEYSDKIVSQMAGMTEMFRDVLTNVSMHNQIGTTTLRRRRLKDGSYHYKLAGERFDFKRGRSRADGQAGNDYGKGKGRSVPFWGQKLMTILLPELAENEAYTIYPAITPKENLNNYGKAFDVVGDFVDERTMNIEDKIINVLK